MKNYHVEKLKIDDTNVDFLSKVNFVELMKLFETATFNHSQLMGLDHESMEKHSNAFWIVSKMKVVLNNAIHTGDNVRVTTWTRDLGTVRALRDCVIKTKNKLNAKFLAEWCCLDINSRNIRRLDSIKYPTLEMDKTNFVNINFTNLKENVDETNYVYSRVVRSSDIDMNYHTNNLKYNYMVLDAFTLDELKSFEVKEYEIYFVNESYFNDTIDIYKKRIKNIYYIEGKIQDRTVFRAVLKTKTIK